MMGYDMGEGSETDADFPEDWSKLLNLSDVDSVEPPPYSNVSRTWTEDQCLNGTWKWNGWTEEERENFKKRYSKEAKEMQTEEMKEKKRASQQRRKAFSEYADEEPIGKDGMTPSQRLNLEKLVMAANMNKACGVPVEKFIDPEAPYQPPGERERSVLSQKEEGPMEEDSKMPSDEIADAIEQDERELMKD
mmetsp:Transcript_16254/g.37114  ORF Transcript_16254/g.37114 Transcript_16254/m.37114 type:complete len:191 (-) Transcript_16254:1913-2485(-)